MQSLPALTALALLAIALAPATARTEPRDPTIAVIGDSLTAGLGVAAGESYPALLEARLRREGYRYRVVNAGVSGDTTAGGLRRIDWVLKNKPEIVIVALGANDALRGLSVAATRSNLAGIVARVRASGARVLLAGMRAPPNYGEPFVRDFDGVFPAVARESGVAFMPFLLDGVAAVPRLNQADGIHPNAAGQQAIADRMWPYLKPLLVRPPGGA